MGGPILRMLEIGKSSTILAQGLQIYIPIEIITMKNAPVLIDKLHLTGEPFLMSL